MQKLLEAEEPDLAEDSQKISLVSTSVCKKTACESLKQVERAIKSVSIPATHPSSTGNPKGCEVIEASGRWPANIQILYEALLTIQPTSIEPERAFGACGFFATKLRSRSHDSIIDALCFTRNALQKQ